MHTAEQVLSFWFEEATPKQWFEKIANLMLQ